MRRPGTVGLRSGSSRPGRGYKLDPCSLSCLHLALMPELAAPSKAGEGELVKGKCLPFALLRGVISGTRKEFWCQVFIPKPHSDNGVFHSHSNPSCFQNFLLQASHKQSFALLFSISSPTFKKIAEAHFLCSSFPPLVLLNHLWHLISLSLVEEAVQVQRSTDTDPTSHSWAVADATGPCCLSPTYPPPSPPPT